MRDVSYPDAVSGHAAVPANGIGESAPASQLGFVRHGARGLPTEEHVSGGIGRWICMAVSAAVFARFDLAEEAGGLARDGAVPGDVLFIQTIEPVLAFADQARSRACCVESDGGVDQAAARSVSEGVAGASE